MSTQPLYQGLSSSSSINQENANQRTGVNSNNPSGSGLKTAAIVAAVIGVALVAFAIIALVPPVAAVLAGVTVGGLSLAAGISVLGVSVPFISLGAGGTGIVSLATATVLGCLAGKRSDEMPNEKPDAWMQGVFGDSAGSYGDVQYTY